MGDFDRELKMVIEAVRQLGVYDAVDLFLPFLEKLKARVKEEEDKYLDKGNTPPKSVPLLRRTLEREIEKYQQLKIYARTATDTLPDVGVSPYAPGEQFVTVLTLYLSSGLRKTTRLPEVIAVDAMRRIKRGAREPDVLLILKYSIEHEGKVSTSGARALLPHYPTKKVADFMHFISRRHPYLRLVNPTKGVYEITPDGERFYKSRAIEQRIF